MRFMERMRTRATERRQGTYLGQRVGKTLCMSTHDYVIDNASGGAVRSDVNSALAAIATLNSGTSWSTTYARMRVADTSAGVVKRRNAANSGWIDVETDDETFVIDRSSNTIWDRSDRRKVFRATGSYTQTIDAAATVGDGWSVAVRVEAGATLTIDPNSSENIDGATTKVIVGPVSGRVHCNGSAFYTEGFVSASTFTTTAPRVLENLGLAVTMAANAVTIALKGADGNDPSASNKVGIGFRHATLTNGQASKVEVVAATSTTISSGSTGGSVSAEASRVWIAAINNSGAVELAWSIRRSGKSVLPVDEGAVISTTAEGGAGGADTVATWYSTTARSNVPFTILGYFDSTQATAGTWASNPTSVVTNPSNRPGDTLQSVVVPTTGVATGTTTTPLDDTIPQNTEGDEYQSAAITPRSASNLLHVHARANVANSNAGGHFIAALHQDSVANALAARAQRSIAADSLHQVEVEHWMLAGTASATTLKNRIGLSAAGTTTLNGISAGRYFGGAMDTQIAVREVSA
jgi:hypothetical protein